MSYNQPISICSNCGGSGHIFRQCVEPVSSYGVLVFRWVGRTSTWTPSSELCKDNRSPNGLVNIVPEILMIQRKDSLGFMDIMRGKYKVNDPEYIKKQLRGMTEKERTNLLTGDFETLWHDLWGSNMELSQRYAHDRIISHQKLTELRAGVELAKGERYTLADLLRQEPGFHTTPEWGFPKGRRDPYETDIQCGYRELEEETGITEDELWKVANVSPFIEQFYGSNDIHYRHSYYLSQYIGNRTISFDALNMEMTREIGDMAWKSMDEALTLLRPENIEKRGILIQVANLLRNFVPVFRDTLVGVSLVPPSMLAVVPRESSLLYTAVCAEPVLENKMEEQERYVFGSRNQRGRVERTKRYFGARQTYRRSPDLYGAQEGDRFRTASRAATGIGGFTLPGHRRHGVFI